MLSLRSRVIARCQGSKPVTRLFSFVQKRMETRREERIKLAREWIKGEIDLLKSLIDEQEKQLRMYMSDVNDKPTKVDDADADSDSDAEIEAPEQKK